MANKQLFLMDDKKIGRLVKVEIFNISRMQGGKTITGKKKVKNKKNYVITGYNRVFVEEEVITEVIGEDGQKQGLKTLVKKEKFVKWGEFSFQEVLHPKDRIKEFLSKVELPLSYITDLDLTEEMIRRELIPLHEMTDETLINEIKRRGLTEFGNAFKISKNASLLQRIKAKLKRQKITPVKKLNFEATIADLKKRKLILPKDFLTDEEVLKELEIRNIMPTIQDFPQTTTVTKEDDFLFEPIHPGEQSAHATPDRNGKPLDLEEIIGKIQPPQQNE